MQLLTNLLGNAIDAIGESGRIKIGIQDSMDWQSMTRRVAVTMADSGPGVLEQYLQKIWGVSFRPVTPRPTGSSYCPENVVKNGGFHCLRTSTNPEPWPRVLRMLLPIHPSEPALRIAQNSAQRRRFLKFQSGVRGVAMCSWFAPASICETVLSTEIPTFSGRQPLLSFDSGC